MSWFTVKILSIGTDWPKQTLQALTRLLLKKQSGSEVIKLFSCSTQLSMNIEMLTSIKISRNSAFSGSDKPRILFFLLINIKMPTTINVKIPTIVGILTFMSRKNFMLILVEHGKGFIISGPDHGLLYLPFLLHHLNAILPLITQSVPFFGQLC